MYDTHDGFDFPSLGNHYIYANDRVLRAEEKMRYVSKCYWHSVAGHHDNCRSLTSQIVRLPPRERAAMNEVLAATPHPKTLDGEIRCVKDIKATWSGFEQW